MYYSSTTTAVILLVSLLHIAFATPIPPNVNGIERASSDWVHDKIMEVARAEPIPIIECTGASCAPVTPEFIQLLENKDDNKDGSSDSLLPKPPGMTTKFAISTLIIFSVLAVMGIAYSIYSYPRILSSSIPSSIATVRQKLPSIPIGKYIPIPTNWRMSESRLIRWAQEDMGLLDISEDDEQGVMVNSRAQFDIIEDGDIPLKPSPNFKRGVFANYGSAWR